MTLVIWAGGTVRAVEQAHVGERCLDLVGGAQVLPMLGGEIEESNQTFPLSSKRLDRLWGLGLILRLETRACGLAVGATLGVHHLVQRALGARVQPLGQLVEDVAEPVTPAALLAG